MSKFHKTFKHHFTIGSSYFLAKNGTSVTEMNYCKFRQGHLIFSNGNTFVDVSGGDIRDRKVIIQNHEGLTFTVNGWEKV